MKLFNIVEAPNGQISYLFGTCHYFFDIPPELIEKLDKNIKHLLVEYALDTDSNLGIEDEKYELSNKRLDVQITLMAKEKGIPITSLDHNAQNLSEYKLEINYDKSGIDCFFSPESALLSYPQTLRIINLYHKQDTTQLADILLMESKNEDPIVHERNKLWLPAIIKSLDEGDALIAVGFGHLFGMQGLIKLLNERGYRLKPFPVTLSFNEKVKEYQEKYIDKNILNGDVSSKLSLMAQAYYRGKIDSYEEKILNSILDPFRKQNSSGFFGSFRKKRDSLTYYKKDPLPLLEETFMTKRPWKIQKENFIYKLLDEKLLATIMFIMESGGSNDSLKLLGFSRRIIFYCHLFYPDIIKNLLIKYMDWVKNHDDDYSFLEIKALKLLLSCGVIPSWKDEYKNCIQQHAPEYFYKFEKRALLPNIFLECRINNNDIAENIYGYLDLPQLGK